MPWALMAARKRMWEMRMAIPDGAELVDAALVFTWKNYTSAQNSQFSRAKMVKTLVRYVKTVAALCATFMKPRATNMEERPTA